MQNLKKIKKLINQASSDQPAEAQQASKMAGAFMVREGVSFEDLLIYKDTLYIDGLMLTARAYAQRTTKTHTEAQKLSAQLYKQINEAYHPSPKTEHKTSSGNNSQESARLQREREELDRKAQELRKKEAEILRREQQTNEKEEIQEPIYTTDPPRQPSTSHNKFFTSLNFLTKGNYFLTRLLLHPFLTVRLFIYSLFQAVISSSFILIIVLILNVFFDTDLTGSLSFWFVYEILVFILLIMYTTKNIKNGWYPN